MIFTNQTKLPPWDSEDALALKQLLLSGTFQKALKHVVSQAPALLDGSDVNQTLVRSGEVKGYEEAISNFFLLTTEQPEPARTEESYPDLDDESRWPDGVAQNTTN